MSKSTKILVLPVYKRTWLFHTLRDEASSALAETEPDWTKGKNLIDKLSLASKQVNHKINDFMKKRWSDMQSAKEGTIDHKLYQAAQSVLSKEDPEESFFKSVPGDTRQLQVIYPASMSEVAVRRRLRMAALARYARHRRQLLGWTLASIPQLPLVLTPFPNVTLYYTVYRLVSSYKAMAGAQLVKSSFASSDQQQLERARRAIAEARLSACKGGRGKRGQGHKAKANTGSPESPQEAQGENPKPRGSLPPPVFLSSRTLDEVVRPLDRWDTPLSDESAAWLSQHFSLSGLEDLLARARRKAMEERKKQRGGKEGGTVGSSSTAGTAPGSTAGSGTGQVPQPQGSRV
mmetsp:Transcript_12753/g.27618  ORF Transcript_12753/g.27618 Transcript_12753/m.27618 type:complete len:347 (-) Transcript_12753:393-1433(-)|eukprot:CAMPEP_0202903750 /NCGR_PEP_ID=MMETSP1392-20130828/26117_1 /ASSEMBLY_ACC=CAM_ASM_000868 /TAXON_ID=225041 /ORGANISM="Chlamydomonas chlamydogama, Strain SAG 11-48b" /LENGTH=346 /DNA_ID=CAMNT_0049591075 /DNA_START=172 /DNA_END=1212 /DNA_ORIENTATION=+